MDLILVGCVKTKREVAAPAWDLFASPLFRKRRAYAEASGLPWFVLSAPHGLLHPDTVIEPYDCAMRTQPVAFRRTWGQRVADQLVQAGFSDVVAEVHAGGVYAEALREPAARLGISLLTPLEGLSQGQHLAWYRSGT